MSLINWSLATFLWILIGIPTVCSLLILSYSILESLDFLSIEITMNFILIISLPVAGALLGFSQWLILKNYLTRCRRWILATAIGFSLGVIAAVMVGFISKSYFIPIGIWLVLLELAQSVEIRHHFNYGNIWIEEGIIPTCLVTLTVGGLAEEFFNSQSNLNTGGWGSFILVVGLGLAAFLFFILFYTITSGVIIRKLIKRNRG
ncbi:MAG: hypothetical protein ACFBSE_26505 [Prochloraceae cyanobacterium]